jgi:hypothetical protein
MVRSGQEREPIYNWIFDCKITADFWGQTFWTGLDRHWISKSPITISLSRAISQTGYLQEWETAGTRMKSSYNLTPINIQE